MMKSLLSKSKADIFKKNSQIYADLIKDRLSDATRFEILIVTVYDVKIILKMSKIST